MIDFIRQKSGVKAMVINMALNRWPYGLKAHASPQGLLVSPCRKARTNWARTFRLPRTPVDELAPTRQLTNDFDGQEWEW